MNASFNILKKFTLLTSLLALAACGSVTRPASTTCPLPESNKTYRESANQDSPLFDNALASSIASRAESGARAPIEINAITLSAGGQWGAFGAGLMYGWSDRPEFDLVTGVSTGALVGVPTFAGREFDGALKEYDGLSEDDVLTVNPFFGLLGYPSGASSAPLERRLRELMTPELIARIADRHADGHRLVVGATNIDTTRFDMFDLGAIASQGATDGFDPEDCIVEALLATSAIPVVLPPRNINNNLYADGGIRDQVFFREIEKVRLAAERDLGRQVNVNAYIVVNGNLMPPSQKVEDGLVDYAVRSISTLTDELLRDSIFEAVQFAQEQKNWTVRGIASSINPEKTCVTEGREAFAFNACLTEKLFAEGVALSQSGPIPWLNADQMRRLALEY